MKYLQITIQSNSNKILDSLGKDIVRAIRTSGAVKAGPIPSKGKRIIYCYSPNTVTLQRLINIKMRGRVTATVLELQRDFT